ncbi:12116_t:CDS:1, partial [Entrophospora sp. SA101]
KIAKLTKTPTQKQIPVNTPHLIPKVKWTMPQIKTPQNYT